MPGSMTARERFAALMARPSEGAPVEETALLVAAEEYPELDVAAYLARLDEMAAAIRPRLRDELDPRRLVAIMNDYLFGTLGFRGNRQEYYDPRNSFLNEVLDRRLGLPITLSIVYVALGARLELPVAGVSFPGHFLVTYQAHPAPLFLDPFSQGRILEERDFHFYVLEHHGPDARFDPHWLRPAPPRDVIVRLLRNLKQIYTAQEDFPRAIACAERILLAVDLPDERRDLGILLSREGRVREAITHLERYVKQAPDAPDRQHVHAHLVHLHERLRRLN